MLLSAVSALVVAQSSSEIPEGLMNNPVQLRLTLQIYPDILGHCVCAYRILSLTSEYRAASGVETQPLSNRTLKYSSFYATNSALIQFIHLLEVDKMIDS